MFYWICLDIWLPNLQVHSFVLLCSVPTQSHFYLFVTYINTVPICPAICLPQDRRVHIFDMWLPILQIQAFVLLFSLTYGSQFCKSNHLSCSVPTSNAVPLLFVSWIINKYKYGSFVMLFVCHNSERKNSYISFIYIL
jgi:hypothetical protein